MKYKNIGAIYCKVWTGWMKKPVVCFDKKWNYFKRYSSITEAADAMMGNKNRISSCLCDPDRNKSAYWFQWRYADQCEVEEDSNE